MNCQTKIGPNRLCEHPEREHAEPIDEDEPRPCNRCDCSGFTTEQYKGEETEEADGDPVLPTQDAMNTAESPYVQVGQPWQDELETDVEKYVEDGKSKAIQKWADSAMFTAEPIDADAGPKVYLLWMTPDPLGVIAATCKMYKGEVTRSLQEVGNAEREDYVKQVLKTKLQAPFEFVKFHFIIEGVTRAFTHQMVRQRTAVYAQESLRFAVKEDMPVGLPPSLAGTEGARTNWEERDYIEAERKREHWDNAVRVIGREYKRLVDLGMPAEDARGLLPHNTLTRLHYCTDLRALLDHAGNRLCTQAQFEWRLVFSRIAQAIRNYNLREALVQQLKNLGEHGAVWAVRKCEDADRWQYKVLADLFRPVCYQTGKCEFMADFDRACNIRDRVQAYHERGISSERWDKGDPGIQVKNYYDKDPIRPIFPAEWLLNSGAAR
jgi:flavin-dependent thymidylate synthase